MEARRAYREHLRRIYHLSSALWLLEWDQETCLGERGVDARADVIGQLTKERFELSVAPELGTWLEALRQDASLSLEEKASVRVVGKQYDRQKAIPASFVEANAKAKAKGQAAWAKAREASDFSLFLPHLDRIVEQARQLAEYYGYEEHPYDALVEEYEPGMTAARLKAIAEPLREGLVPFIEQLMSAGTPPDTSLIEGGFDLEDQRTLSRRALQAIGYDFDGGALHDVEHPFTTAIAYGDVRVTNSYRPNSLVYGLFGALHEGGHALYHQGMPEELYLLRLEEGASSGIDESQSLMMENQLGRGRAFWTFFHPIAAEVFPALRENSPEDVFRAVNRVEPGLIRLVADEVTYNLHIMLRFELEMDLIGGDLKPEDLPDRWNDAMERTLGVRPTSDAVGVLQDVHWAAGYFGYFPSYMLGSLYAAQIWAALQREYPDVDERIAAGDMATLVAWLRERIHRHGGVFEPDELIVQITGQPLDASHFLEYVRTKYSEVYRLRVP